MLLEILREVWMTLTAMAPYLLFGFFMAGVLSLFISPEFVERHLGGRGVWQVVKAAVFGIPLPLCSCSVIPVAASLRRHGAGRGATAAFLISTPQTGVDSILATMSLLGPIFAVFRTLAAFVSGVLGGILVDLVGNGAETTESVPACTDACCSEKHKPGRFARAMHHGFITLTADIAKPLLIGLLLAALIAALVPESFFAETIGPGWPSMLLMLLIGIPIYVCATASIPIAAAMMLKGVSPGAALVFLMTGPATNMAALATLWTMFGRRTAITFLVVVALTALGSGLVLDLLVDRSTVVSGTNMHAMLPPIVKHAAAVVLLIILGLAMRVSSLKHG